MNIAVILTILRVIIAPIFAFFFIYGYKHTSPLFLWLSALCAILIELTDLFDGMVARSRSEVTDFGKVFDPIADSVSRQTVFLSFFASGIIPLWLYLIFFYRDAFMQLLRIVCASNGVVLAARKSGKLKAVLQGIASFIIIAIVLIEVYNRNLFPTKILGMHLAFWILLVPAFYTLGSVVDYVIPNKEMLKRMMKRKKV
ncbi:MAG: CDP-alcohol phosphatidyltransferase family protein [Chitinispirillaceae bacterium]|nr:CDP-alcohol phosphatidyltransferase family protein [Chitinispirillaceae bacterium]